MGVRSRVLLVVALAMVPLFAFTFQQGLEERREVAARERASARRLARLLAAEHGRVLNDARDLLFVLAETPDVIRADPQECADLFRRVLAVSPGYQNVMLAERDGRVVASARPVEVDDADRALIMAAAAQPQLQVRLEANPGGPLLTVARAAPSSGQTRHVLLARPDMSWIAARSAFAQFEETTVVLWDGDGDILLRYPDPERYTGTNRRRAEVWQSIQGSSGEGSAEAIDEQGRRRFYGFAPIPGTTTSYLSVGVPTDVALADLRRRERRNVAILIVATMLGGLVAWFGGERLLVRLVGRLQRRADHDGLTGLANRRRFLEAGEAEYLRARRFGHPMSVLMLDLDFFKKVNDQFGHGAGDDVLVEMARRIQTVTRSMDLPARYGGEEFAVLLPDASAERAREVAERIRAAVADSPVRSRKGPVAVTLSIGVATAGAATSGLTSLLDAADRALYSAKAGGRNRVTVADVTEPEGSPVLSRSVRGSVMRGRGPGR